MSPTFPPAGYVAVPSAVPGIEVYAPAKSDTDSVEGEARRETVEFHCPQCGAGTTYSATHGALACTRCGYKEAPKADTVGQAAQTFEFDVDTLERAARGWGQSRLEIACSGCGAHVTVPEGALTAACPYCASNKVVPRQASQDTMRPRFVVPFTLDAQALEPVVRQWLGSSWMTPRALADSVNPGRLEPVYVPYWTFDARADAQWQAEVGVDETQHRFDGNTKQMQTHTVTHWHNETGQATQHFADLLVVGTDKLGERRLNEIGNFDTAGLVAYDASLLAGTHAQAHDVALEPAWAAARHRMREATRNTCRASIRGDHVANFVMSLDFADERWRNALLPVYVAAYRHEGKTYRVLVNGQTGAIAGQRPVDRKRVRLAITALLAPGAVLALAGLVTLAMGLGAVLMAAGLVLMFFGGVIASGIRDKARSMDDD